MGQQVNIRCEQYKKYLLKLYEKSKLNKKKSAQTKRLWKNELVSKIRPGD